jgi:DNA-binding XRE family transcriptional regulator/biotin operon repressor
MHRNASLPPAPPPVDPVEAAVRAGPGRSAAQLARSLGISANTVTRRVNRLESLGILARRRHGRSVAIWPADALPADPRPEGLGPRLVALRARLGLTQAEAARRAGVPTRTISRAESGERSPMLASVLAWCRAWGATREDAADALLADLPPRRARR